MFLHPMWRSESQRIGKQKCTPLGYALHVCADVLGFSGFLVFFISGAMLLWKAVTGGFRLPQLGMLAIGVGLGIFSEVLYQLSWWLAHRKGFQYDDSRCEASWLEGGERLTYRYAAEAFTAPDSASSGE